MEASIFDPAKDPPDKDERMKITVKWILDRRDEIKRTISDLSVNEMAEHVFSHFDGSVFQVTDFKTCSVCRLPTLFFHDKTRCKRTEKFPHEDVEDYLITMLMKVNYTSKIIKVIEGELQKQYRLQLAASAPPPTNQNPPPPPHRITGQDTN